MYKMRKPFDLKKLTSYFKQAERVIVQKVGEYTYLADGYALYRFKQLPEELKHLEPPTEGDSYQKYKGEKELSLGGPRCDYLWGCIYNPTDAHTIYPTITLIEPEEGKLYRLLNNSEIEVYILKQILDNLSTYVGSLEKDYRFETMGDKKPVMVYWRVNPSGYKEEWEPVAMCMPRITRERLRWE
jgi:hypothetical protein